MYRFEEKQLSFTDFNQPQGLQMNPENRWVKKAEMIPWDTIEKEYAHRFHPCPNGRIQGLQGLV